MTDDYFCDERETSPVDDEGGVARRWTVVHLKTHELHTVTLMRPDGGRFMAQPSLRCQCGRSGCPFLAAVAMEISRTLPPAAA